jgi:hypothetical protein
MLFLSIGQPLEEELEESRAALRLVDVLEQARCQTRDEGRR